MNLLSTFAIRRRYGAGFCHTVFAIVVFSMCSSVSQYAAAGCYLHQIEQRTLDPQGNPLPTHFRKEYDGGVFKYYKLPSGTPCNGPSCKSAPNQSVSCEPAVIGPERIISSLIANESRQLGDLIPISQCLPTSSLAFDTPFLSGLLRPPSI